MSSPEPPSEESIASILLDIEAVSLQPHKPFTWASGLHSPVYCDNRLLMGYPEARRTVVRGFEHLIYEHQHTPDLIAGTATAGIPHAAWLADRMALPMVYVRSKPKMHGRLNQVEGRIQAGQSAVIVEDLISTGKSSIGAVKALVEEGVKVLAVVAIFSYGFEVAREAFQSASVPFYTLTSYDTLLRVAHDKNLLDQNDLDILRVWRDDPQAWSESHR